MAYTLEELQKMGAKPVTAPTAPTATAPQKKSYTAEELQKLGAKPVEASVVQPEQKDGMLKSLAKGIIKPVATLAARPLQLGATVLGASADQVNKATKSIAGDFVAPVPESGKDVLRDVGRVAETLSLGVGGGALGAGVKGLIKQGAIQGAKSGALYGAGSALENDKGLGGIATDAVVGGLSGGVLGGAAPIVSKAVVGVKNKVAPSQDFLKLNLDNKIRNIFKGTTGDIAKVDDMAFKARKGLELLMKESPTITIPDAKAPLGARTPLGERVTKPFDLSKSSPNELLSGVLEMDKKITSNARSAVEKAKTLGFKVDTSTARSYINDSIMKGEIPASTGQRMIQQIDNLGDDPVAVHDWVQNINTRFKKKYERNTIDDTVTGKVADDIADLFRENLDTIVDRKGYAEAFGNNQELKRMLVTLAKKANKGVNFGDISTDAGLDLGISLLTGNPVYMARTIGTGAFKGIMGNLKNKSGIKTLKKAADSASKVPTATKLPSAEAKRGGSLSPAGM
jgi:hypothetical protein